jgi:aminopeptidase YwaD
MPPEVKPPSEAVEGALRLTAEIIGRYGARLAGSEPCRQAALRLAKEFEPHCSSVEVEEFSHHPRAFLGHLRIAAAINLGAAAALYLGGLLPAFLLLLLGHLVTLLEFGLYREAVDPCYARRSGFNVVCRVEPRGPVKQQVVLSAHHDSAYEFWYLAHMPWLYVFLVVASTLLNIAVPTLLAIQYLTVLAGHAPFLTPWILRELATVLIVANAPFFFFLSSRGTPGAGDNLVAVCLLTKLAAQFAPTPAGAVLENTRLWFVSFDAEEAGLRGSRAFARAHGAELNALPTHALNLESLFDVKALRCLTSDINGTVRLSRETAETCARLGRKLGYTVSLTPMVYGYGATDAAELAKVGVPATSLVGLNPDFTSGKVTYHTHNDVVEGLQPEAIQAGLDNAAAFIQDREQALACPEPGSGNPA